MRAITFWYLFYWPPGCCQNGPMICGTSVRASVQRFCLDWLISFFFKLSMLLEAHVVLHVTARFFEKKLLPQKWGKCVKMGFFEFIEKFRH